MLLDDPEEPLLLIRLVLDELLLDELLLDELLLSDLSKIRNKEPYKVPIYDFKNKKRSEQKKRRIIPNNYFRRFRLLL